MESALAAAGRPRAEREAIAGALAGCAPARASSALEGEPGIGKSRLLAYLADGRRERLHRAGGAGDGVRGRPAVRAVARGAGSPLAALGERRCRARPRRRGGARGDLPRWAAEPAAADRHRVHRALRDLLERLAAARPLVVCLDDVHWADPASIDALAALVRRPPARAGAARAGRPRGPAAGAAGAALAPRGRRLRGCARRRSARPRRPSWSATRATGDLRRGRRQPVLPRAARARARRRAAAHGAAARSPPAVAAALAAELGGCSSAAHGGCSTRPRSPATRSSSARGRGRRARRGPRCARWTSCCTCALVRPAGAPRRFAFRHPIVRHAVYEAAPGGWRLGAHARAARRAASAAAPAPVERAHHVEQRPRRATRRRSSCCRRAAARAAALRAGHRGALPRRGAAAVARGAGPRAPRMQARLADAQAAAGDAAAARETLLAALGRPRATSGSR